MTEPAAAPRPPGLGELFEQSLIAVVDPSVFRRAAARPAPSFGAAGGLAAACGAAALGIGAAHVLVGDQFYPAQLTAPLLAAMGVAGVGLYASLLLLLSVLLYTAGNALGGKGEFDRGLQAAAMLAVLAPVQMLCNWFPAFWVVPALLAAWIAACALEGFFNASRGPVRAVCAVAAAAAIGLQFAGRALVDRAHDAYAAADAMRRASAPNAELLRSVTALSLQTAAAPASLPAAAAPASATSGLDLLRGGLSDDGGGAGPNDAFQPTQAPAAVAPQIAAPFGDDAAAQAMQASAAGMLDALTPMLNMLTASNTLRPGQKADIKELQSLMQDLKVDMAARKKMDNAVFQTKMRRYQTLLMKVMSYAPAPQAGAPQPRAVHLQVPKDGS